MFAGRFWSPIKAVSTADRMKKIPPSERVWNHENEYILALIFR